MMCRVLRVAALFALAPAASLAGPRDPGVTAKPSGRALSGQPAGPSEQPADFSRQEFRRDRLSSAPGGADYAEAALRGEAWAQTKLAKKYMANPGDRERWLQGMDYLRRAAEQDDAEAIFLLATVNAAGAGPEPSALAAFGQIERAAALGFADAQFVLGTMHLEGSGTPQDEVKALASFRRAAEGGNTDGMCAAGRLLLSQPDPEMRAEGLAWMNRAVDSGHTEALLLLATAYGRGADGLPKDEAKAEALLRPPAERGNADCQMVLASLYKFGDSFADRRDEAWIWLQRAADQGHSRALEILRSEER